MAAKTAVLSTATEGPFEGKHGRALVEVYSPAHRFWTPRTKMGFLKKKWIHFKGEGEKKKKFQVTLS